MLPVKKIPSWNGNTVWDPVEFLHVKKNEMPLTSCNPFPLSIFPKFPCIHFPMMKHHSFMHLRPSTFENRRGPPVFFPTKSQASSKQYRQYYPHNIQQLNGWNHGQATKWSRTESLGMIPDQCAGPHPSACAGSGVAPSKARARVFLAGSSLAAAHDPIHHA